MEEPPEAILKQVTDHHGVVTLAHVALIMIDLVLVGLSSGNGLLLGQDILNGSLIDLFTEDVSLALCVDLVLFPQILDHIEDEFLFDGVRVLPNSEGGWKELIPGELHAESLAKFDGVGDVLKSLLL